MALVEERGEAMRKFVIDLGDDGSVFVTGETAEDDGLLGVQLSEAQVLAFPGGTQALAAWRSGDDSRLETLTLKKDSAKAGTKTTSPTGTYKVTLRITGTTKVQVTYAGNASCKPSHSKRPTIKVG